MDDIDVPPEATDPRRWELTPDESERRFRAIFDRAINAMLISDDEGRYVDANPAACALLGRTREELLRLRIGDVSALDTQAHDAFAEFRRTGKGVGRWVVTRPDGETRDVEYAAVADFLPGLHLSILMDVTARRAVESELARKSELLQTVFDNIPAMVTLLDRDGHVEWVNREWERLFGWSAAEVQGVEILTALLPDAKEREAALQFIRSASAGGWRDFRVLTRHGRLLDTSWANIELSDGRIVGIGQEVTERKRREADRERWMGRLHAKAEFAIAICTAPSIAAIPAVLTERARLIIGARAAVTRFTVDASGNLAVGAVSAEGVGAGEENWSWPERAGFSRQVCRTNLPMRMTRADLDACPGVDDDTAATRRPAGWLAVPLVARDSRNLGLLELSGKVDGEFDEEDEGVAVELAQMASAALENARLLLEVSAARTRLETLSLSLERLSRRLVTLQEEERHAIARELHDEVGQLLTGLSLMIEAGEGASPVNQEMRRVVNELIRRVGDLSMNLRPPMLDELGLLPTLLWQIERFEKQTGVHVELRCATSDHRFPRRVELTVFRIVQEALTNIARHAGVTTAKVEVWASGESLGARIEDRGRGFSPAALHDEDSVGLAGMRERCRLLGGSLTLESRPGDGTRLSVELPTSPSASSIPALRSWRP